MICMVNWDRHICSPSEWVERCYDVRVVNWLHHEVAHQPSVRNIRICFPSIESVEKRIRNGSTQFWQHGSYQDRNFMSCGCGTNRDPPSRHRLHFFLYACAFLCTCKCTQKYAYKQLRSGNVICGLISFFAPFHYPRDWGTHVMELPQDLWTDKPTNSKHVPTSHTQRFQRVESLTGNSSYSWSPVLLILTPGFPVGQCLQLLWNISAHIEKFLYIPVLAEVNVFKNDHCAAPFYSPGPHSAKPWVAEVYTLLYFPETQGMDIIPWSKFPFQSSMGGTQTVLCNLDI